MTGPPRRFAHGLLGVVLFGGVLAPAVAEALDHHAYGAIVTLAGATAALALSAAMLGISRLRPSIGASRVVLSFATVVLLGIILDAQVNSFYTARALFSGMVTLLFLHVVAVVMRRVTLRDDEVPSDVTELDLPADVLPSGVERLPPNEVRVVRAGRQGITDMPTRWRERADPALILDDSLADGATWLLIAFWMLVAFGRRHVASGILVLGAILLAARCLALLPDVLATRHRASGR